MPKPSRRWMPRCGTATRSAFFRKASVTRPAGSSRCGRAPRGWRSPPLAQGIDVQLVPVGINPEDKADFRSRLTIVYGHPFRIAATARPAEVTAEIAAKMRHLIVEADPDADAELVMRIDRLYAAERETSMDPAAAIERRRTIASGLDRLRDADPARYEAAILQLRRYDQRLARFGLRDRTLDWTPSRTDALKFAAREVPLALVLVPVVMAAAVVFAVPYYLTALIGRFQRDTDVTATAKVVAGSVLYPLWILAVAIAVGVRSGALWGLLAAIALPLLAIAGLFALERETSALRTVRSWFALRGTSPRTRAAPPPSSWRARRRSRRRAYVDESVDPRSQSSVLHGRPGRPVLKTNLPCVKCVQSQHEDRHRRRDGISRESAGGGLCGGRA